VLLQNHSWSKGKGRDSKNADSTMFFLRLSICGDNFNVYFGEPRLELTIKLSWSLSDTSIIIRLYFGNSIPEEAGRSRTLSHPFTPSNCVSLHKGTLVLLVLQVRPDGAGELSTSLDSWQMLRLLLAILTRPLVHQKGWQRQYDLDLASNPDDLKLKPSSSKFVTISNCP